MKIGKTEYNVDAVKNTDFEQFAKDHSFLSDPKKIYEKITGKKVEKKKAKKVVKEDE